MPDGQHHGAAAGESSPGSALAGTAIAAASLSSEERHALEAAAIPIRSYNANADLVREGEGVDQLFIVTEGWACRYKTTRDGSRQIVAMVVPGDVANLDTLMLGRPDFGVRILAATKVVAIPCERALALVGQHPGIARMFTRLALVENAILSQWALCLGRKSAQQRLAHLFCELAVRVVGAGRDAASFELPLTQEQLADALGLTSVHVNRMMQQLRSEALIETPGRSITLPDIPRLRALAEFDPAYLHIGAAAVERRGKRSPAPTSL